MESTKMQISRRKDSGDGTAVTLLSGDVTYVRR